MFGELQETYKERMVKVDTAEAEISWLLVPKIVKAPKALDPTFPIMQRNIIFPYTLVLRAPQTQFETQAFC